MKLAISKFGILSYFVLSSIILFGITLLAIRNILMNLNTNATFDFNSGLILGDSIKCVLVILSISCFIGISYGQRKKDASIKHGFIYCTVYTLFLVTSYIVVNRIL